MRKEDKMSRKKEVYIEDLKKSLRDIVKNSPKPPSFRRIVSLAVKGGYFKVIRR